MMRILCWLGQHRWANARSHQLWDRWAGVYGFHTDTYEDCERCGAMKHKVEYSDLSPLHDVTEVVGGPRIMPRLFR